jgi:hypothetical protein
MVIFCFVIFDVSWDWERIWESHGGPGSAQDAGWCFGSWTVRRHAQRQARSVQAAEASKGVLPAPQLGPPCVPHHISYIQAGPDAAASLLSLRSKTHVEWARAVHVEPT